MARIISFEKFAALSAAGLSEQQIKSVKSEPQMHSASENMVQTIQHRSTKAAQQRGY